MNTFAFSCVNKHVTAAIRCLDLPFGLYKIPNHVQCDWGTTFMSKDLKDYLSQKWISTKSNYSCHPTQANRSRALLVSYRKQSFYLLEIPYKYLETGAYWDITLPNIIALYCNKHNIPWIFAFQCCSFHGNSLPSLLMTSGHMLVRWGVKRKNHL